MSSKTHEKSIDFMVDDMTSVINFLNNEVITLGKKAEAFDKIVSAFKTPGGRISEHGKKLIPTLRDAGLSKSDIAKMIGVSPAALTPYD